MTSEWFFKDMLRNETKNFLISKLCFPWLVYTLMASNSTHYYLTSSSLFSLRKLRKNSQLKRKLRRIHVWWLASNKHLPLPSIISTPVGPKWSWGTVRKPARSIGVWTHRHCKCFEDIGLPNEALLRGQESGLQTAWQPRSSARIPVSKCGWIHIRGIEIETQGEVIGRFFSFHPPREICLRHWLIYWMRKGCVPVLTLNEASLVTKAKRGRMCGRKWFLFQLRTHWLLGIPNICIVTGTMEVQTLP